MKQPSITREELMRLLRNEPISESSVTPSSAASPPDAPARASMLTPVHFLLARALPRLWQYANRQPEAAERRTLRRKLRELMSWALTKGGHQVQTSAATLYRHQGESVQGRLELLVLDAGGASLLAIESDWLGDEPSLLKLEAWHRRGVPALWVVGRRCEREMLYKIRSLANRTLHQNTLTWLAIYHLDHGWVWSGSPPGQR